MRYGILDGYTYAFYCGFSGLTKIGKSGDPQKRFSQLATGRKLSVIAIIKGDIELDLHRLYKPYRMVGEWFNLSDIHHQELIAHPKSVLRYGLDRKIIFPANITDRFTYRRPMFQPYKAPKLTLTLSKP